MTKKLTAKTADKYTLYQRAVQSADQDVIFLSDTYKSIRGTKAKHFREDFCGTCLLTSEWIQQGKNYTAESYDIDPEPLKWGYENNLTPLGEIADRAKQFQQDAHDPSKQAPDIRCAQNFSYWIFKTRIEMLNYFSGVYNDLADTGIFVIDLHGGPESLQEQEEETEVGEGAEKFTYVWDQDSINPITSEARLHIHFRFPDGTEMTDAFTYDWRLWGLTELREILEEAGFNQVDCYWEGTDEDGESGNGVFSPTTQGEACLSYVTYLVGVK